MNTEKYSDLQVREIFHLEFLRRFARKAKAESYAVKGGANFRFFFNSIRYSEDMDIDLKGIRVDTIKNVVMKIFESADFRNTLKSYGVDDIVSPNISHAKQTETTQRFKVHLITFSGEDLFTKVEFSRRGFCGKAVVEDVADNVLRAYKMTPLVISHYDESSAAVQKIDALASRAAVQARDVFDLYIIHPRLDANKLSIDSSKIKKALENLFEISFERFMDTVVSYLELGDQALYATSARWDEIKLRVASFLEEIKGSR